MILRKGVTHPGRRTPWRAEEAHVWSPRHHFFNQLHLAATIVLAHVEVRQGQVALRLMAPPIHRNQIRAGA
jgi:hypothetical protein